VNGVVRSVSTFRESLSARGHNVFIFTHESEPDAHTEPFVFKYPAINISWPVETPLVFTFHTRYRDYSHYLPIPMEAIQELVRNSIDHWLINFLQRCHHIIVPTPGMRDILANDYGVQS